MVVRTSLLCVLVTSILFSSADAASLRGRLVNGTTGETGRADVVELIDLAAGMDALQTLEDVEGSFVFTEVPDVNAAHLLLRFDYDGIHYTQGVTELDSETELVLEVYESTDSLEDLEVSRRHVLFQRSEDHIQVTELLEFSNNTSPARAVRADAFPMRLHLPVRDIHGEVDASVGSSTMPLKVTLVETDEAEIFGVTEALPPGVTRLIARYLLHYPGDELSWTSRAVYTEQDRRVLVSPTDIQVLAAQMIPAESPLEGFNAWTGLPLEAGGLWEVELSGGSAVTAQSTPGRAASQVDRVEVSPNRMSRGAIPILLGLSAAMLLGLLIGLSRGKAPAHTQGSEALDENRRRISRLADRYVSGEIDRAHFEKERDHILSGKSAKKRASAPRGHAGAHS